MQYLLIYVLPFLPSGIPWSIHLITRLYCSALRQRPFQDLCLLWLLLTSHSSLLLQVSLPMRPHGINQYSFLVYLPDLRTRVTVAFWTSLFLASLSAVYALYQIPVRQATILLSLPLAYTSRCKPWESLWGSSATTPLVDFHHRLTACPSYRKNGIAFAIPIFLHLYALVSSILLGITYAVPVILIVAVLHCGYIIFVYRKLCHRI